MASSWRLNDAGAMVGKAAHGRLISLAMAVNSNSLHFGRLMVTPSANRNSYRVAKVVRDDTQGRGAAHLNPGLGNRNSCRVAFGCVLAHIISTHRKNRGLQWLQLNPGLGNRNSYRVAFGCVLAHIISTHRKDGDSQWPKLWAGKTVGLGKRNSIRFPLCAVTFGLDLPLGT